MKIRLNVFGFILLLPIFLGVGSCKISEEEKHPVKPARSEEAAVKEFTLFEHQKLDSVKANLTSSEYNSAYQKLLDEADYALEDTVFSVTFKKLTPPSGDKRDYLSYGPYWWPDPVKADGLPWIRRDGEVNPLSRNNNTDYTTKSAFFNNVSDLSWAFFFSDNEAYATKLVELLQVWFLDEKTKMNPNLEFAQGIPGINTGRGIGIIDFAGITKVITAIEILESKGAITIQKSNELRQWFTNYLDWLETSKNGVFERDRLNNHGTWYDNQVVSIMIFLNRREEAKKVLKIARYKRIADQLEDDGSQPLELERTKSLHYSVMNLRAMTQLAYFGKRIGVDLWNFSPDDGGGIKQAYEYLKPYATTDKKWEYKQIQSMEDAKKELRELFATTGCFFDVPEFLEIGKDDIPKKEKLFFNFAD
ncbi:MAG: alginate lyase family protein [Leeuwenhoekiella sp.]